MYWLIFRRPASAQDDDWIAERPLGARASFVQNGLEPAFGREFLVRSTDPAVTIPRPLQEFLLLEGDRFTNSETRQAVLVLDEKGWGFNSTLSTEEGALNGLVRFQKELTQILGKP